MLRVGGPARSVFLLTLPRAPRVSFTRLFLPPRETAAPAPAPVRRSAAATPASPLRCRTRAAPAPLRQRPRTRHACARATLRRPALPAPRAAADHDPLHRRSTFPSFARALLYSSTLLVPQPGISSILYTLCSGALKVFEELPLRFFFAFFPDLQGYGLYTPWQSEIPLIHHPLHTCTYTHTLFLILQTP